MPSTNAGAGPTAGQTVDEVDDYEYEYDENETEVSRIPRLDFPVLEYQ
jgi:hypothetical protein